MSRYNNPVFKILIVDDDPDLLQITERLLKNEQYVVTTATSGQECIQTLGLDKPDLLLLDVMLPDISGVDICKKIRNDKELSSIYIILLSGMKTDSEDISLGLETGADGYLIKPLKKRELLARVEAAFRIIQAEKTLFENEGKLRELIATKDKFLSIIAHDLRGPFNGFLGLTQIMAEELSDLTMEEIQKKVISMRNSAVNLFSLLENLLEWTRMQQGLISFEPDVIELHKIVAESISFLLETANNKEIQLTYDIPKDWVVKADRNMLQTVLRNLVSNALKFTHNGGKVTISASAGEDHNVVVAIKDTGIGMSHEMVANSFRLDVQTGRKGTNGEPSSGLGLLLCKEFIEKHGGKIWVESEEGVGSTFYFTLGKNNS